MAPSTISNLPLQDMIAGVVNQATEKLANQQATVPDEKTPEVKAEDQTAESWTDPVYVEKLASACDFIAQNIDGIETPNRGVLGNAIDKMAGVEVPPAVTTPEQLSVQASMPGTQKYKKDTPKGEDAAASQASTPEGTAGLPAGKTQMKNDMDSAPGQGSGSVPTAEYPPAGPFHSGSKTAMVDLLKKAGSQVLQKEAMCGTCKKAGEKCACTGTKTAGEAARAVILRKLAGEDVMKAKISGDKGGGPLVGDGVMDAHQAEQVPSNATDGSGYGNPQRTHVQGNQAAIDMTKADAKKPQGKQMSEVLTNPAFSPAHDTKLREQLRNAGQAGVKIAGANASAIVKQAAAEGRITQETVNQFARTGKIASDSNGCECGGEGTCKVCKLKAATEKQSQDGGSGAGMMGGGGMGY